MRNGRDEIRFGRVELFVLGDVVEDDYIPDEVLLFLSDRADVERDILHLEITLFVIRINFERLVVLFGRIETADQPPQQVVAESHFRRIFADHVDRFEVQDRKSLVVHKENLLVGVEPDDRFVQAVDDRFDPFFVRHQVLDRAAPVLRQFFGHLVERFGNGLELFVVFEVQPLIVVEIRDFENSLFQHCNRLDHAAWEAYQENECDQHAEHRGDRQPPHRLFGRIAQQAAFGLDCGHVQLHDAVEVAAD